MTLAGGAGSAFAQSQPVRWRMSTMWPKSLDAMHGSAEAMAKRVGEITEGRFTIQATAAGEIVPAFICTNPSIAVRLPVIAANSCCISGGGGSSVAS